MKKAITFFTFFIFINTVFSQITFNHRYHFDLPNAVLTNILPTDSCYYGIGIIGQFTSSKTGNIFVKFDLDGNILFQKSVVAPTKSYEAWLGNMQEDNNGNFLVTAYSTDNSGMKGMLIKYNNDGDTIFTKEYLSPNYPDDSFYLPKDLIIDSQDNIVTINWHDDSLDIKEIGFLKVDSIGNILTNITYGNEMNEQPTSILEDSNSGYIIGNHSSNLHFVNEGYIYQTLIFKIDTLGQIEWEYLSPIDQLEAGANAMVKTNDGGLIIASGIGTEIDRSSVNEIFWEGYIYKLDESFNKVWEIDYTDKDTASHWLTEFTRLLEVEDGYVAAGYNYDKAFPSPVDGWLVKFSADGERIWSRKYHYLEDSSNTTIHQVFDMERTSDGGFVIVGQAKHFNHPTSQQAWILKVDEHGCLVPDCQLVDALENPIHDFTLQLYPNPTSNQLNIYFSTQDFSSDEKFRLVDLEGKAVKVFDIPTNETTYMLSVESVPSGIYFLQYLKNNVSVKTEQVIIRH